MTAPATSRRNFLKTGWKVGVAFLAAAAGWTMFESLRPLGSSGKGGPIKLSSTSNYAPGTATYVPEGRLYIANTGTNLFAVSQKCPHLGCRVKFCDSSGWFECPCHGSLFDIGGEWIQGPSPVGMSRYALTTEGDTLVVDTSETLPSPPRGENQYFVPRKGPDCKSEG